MLRVVVTRRCYRPLWEITYNVFFQLKMPQLNVWLGTMLLWKVCLSIGVWMTANICLYTYCIPLLNDKSFLYWRKLCWSNWGVKSNIWQSLSWSSNNMCTEVTWYCLTSREFMIFINSHAIDNNRMYVLFFFSLTCIFNGFKIIIPLFF